MGLGIFQQMKSTLLVIDTVIEVKIKLVQLYKDFIKCCTKIFSLVSSLSMKVCVFLLQNSDSWLYVVM